MFPKSLRRGVAIVALFCLIVVILLGSLIWHNHIAARSDTIFGGRVTLTWHAIRSPAGRWATLDMPGRVQRTEPYGINDAGEVVGIFTDQDNRNHGFTFIAGVYHTLDVPQAKENSAAQGINNKGDIVGYYGTLEGSARTHGLLARTHGFLFSHGKFVTIDGPESITHWTILTGINDKGEIVGTYYDSKTVAHGFVWQRGILKPINIPDGNDVTPKGIDNDGRIVGNYTKRIAADDLSEFILDHGVCRTFSSRFVPNGISGRRMVGTWYDEAHRHSFEAEWGVPIAMNIPNAAFENGAWSINGKGEIVGIYQDSKGHSHGYLFVPERVPQSSLH